MRLMFLMQTHKSSVSDSDLIVVERACELVLAVDDKLKAQAHSRTAPAVAEVRDALVAAEIALRRILI